MMNVGVLLDVKYCLNYVVSMLYILRDIIALCNLCLLHCADFGEGDLSGPCKLAS